MRCKGGSRGSTREAALAARRARGTGAGACARTRPTGTACHGPWAGGAGAVTRAACLALAPYVMLRPSKKGVRSMILQTTFPQMFGESGICGRGGNVCARCGGCQCLRMPTFCTTLGVVLASGEPLLPRSKCLLARSTAASPADGVCPLKTSNWPSGGAVASVQGSKFRCPSQ